MALDLYPDDLPDEEYVWGQPHLSVPIGKLRVSAKYYEFFS